MCIGAMPHHKVQRSKIPCTLVSKYSPLNLFNAWSREMCVCKIIELTVIYIFPSCLGFLC